MFFLPDTTNLIHCHAINFNCVQLVSAYNGLCGSNKNQEVYIFKHETRGIIQTRKGYNKYLHIVNAIRISHSRSVYSTIVCCFVTTCFHTICPWQALAYYYCHWWPSQVWTFSLPLPLPGQVVTAKLLPIASLLRSYSSDHDLRLDCQPSSGVNITMSTQRIASVLRSRVRLSDQIALLTGGREFQTKIWDKLYTRDHETEIRWRNFLEAPGLCCLQSVTIVSPASCQTREAKIDFPIWIFCELLTGFVSERYNQESLRLWEDDLQDPWGQEASYLESSQWQECPWQQWSQWPRLCDGEGEAGRHGQWGGHHGGGEGGQHRPPHRQQRQAPGYTPCHNTLWGLNWPCQ